jgi:hypothetical protein
MPFIKPEVLPIIQVAEPEEVGARIRDVNDALIPGFVIPAAVFDSDLENWQINKSVADAAIRSLGRVSLKARTTGLSAPTHTSKDIGLHFDGYGSYQTRLDRGATALRIHTGDKGAATVLLGTVKADYLQATPADELWESISQCRDLYRSKGVIDSDLYEPVFFEGEIGEGDTVVFLSTDRRNFTPAAHNFISHTSHPRRLVRLTTIEVEAPVLADKIEADS